MFLRYLFTYILIFSISIFSIDDSSVYLQWLLGDANNGVISGNYDITFGLYTSNNEIESSSDLSDNRIWYESTTNVITEGQLTHELGSVNELNYKYFKHDELYVMLYFDNSGDYVYVPLIAAPASIYAEFSDKARVLEDTENWLEVSTENHRIGIGITENLTVALEVVGTINATHVTADAMFSPDGYEIYDVDYWKLKDVDDYSLSPWDGVDGTTENIVFVTSSGNVGINIPITANIKYDLHVSGHVYINGSLGGNSNIEFIGTSNQSVTTTNDVVQLIWNSQKGAFRAGYASDDNWSSDNSGYYSVAFGRDNKVQGDYSFSAGKDNQITTGDSSVVLGGQDNIIDSNYSGILAGQANEISGVMSGVLAGEENVIEGDASVIVGGAQNTISDVEYSVILGGFDNVIYSDYSLAIGYDNSINNDDGYGFAFGYENEVNANQSFAFGKTAIVNSEAENTFVFSDGSTDFESSDEYGQQFVIYAQNGVGVGISDTMSPFDIDDHEVEDFTPSYNSLRVAGDIIAENDDGNGESFGYIIGDGRYLTNINSIWYLDSTYDYVYVTENRVGIGTASPNTNTQLHIQEVYVGHLTSSVADTDFPDLSDYLPAHIRIEDLDGNLLQLSVSRNSDISYVDSSVPIHFLSDDNLTLVVNDDETVSINAALGINVSAIEDSFGIENTAIGLDVSGDVELIGNVDVSGDMLISGSVTANSFAGDGSELTDVPVYELLRNTSDSSRVSQLMVSSNGYIGVGTVTNNMAQWLHIGEESGEPQFRLDQTNLSQYTTFQSSTQLDIVVHDFDSDEDTVFEISAEDTDDNTQSLFMITAEGNIGIGLTTDGLDNISKPSVEVSGNVSANAFIGSGEYLTDIQLDMEQVNNVTFNATAYFDDMLHLEPFDDASDIPSCTNTQLGLVYTYSGSNSEIEVCICTAAGTRASLVSSTCTDSE